MCLRGVWEHATVAVGKYSSSEWKKQEDSGNLIFVVLSATICIFPENYDMNI